MVHVYVSECMGVPSCAGGGVVGSAEGREEMATHQLTAQTARVDSIGGDKYCMHTRTQANTSSSFVESHTLNN